MPAPICGLLLGKGHPSIARAGLYSNNFLLYAADQQPGTLFSASCSGLGLDCHSLRLPDQHCQTRIIPTTTAIFPSVKAPFSQLIRTCLTGIPVSSASLTVSCHGYHRPGFIPPGPCRAKALIAELTCYCLSALQAPRWHPAHLAVIDTLRQFAAMGAFILHDLQVCQVSSSG